MSDIEREAFERWYIDHMAKEGMKPETMDRMKEMREGDDYGKRGYLNGCWHGWQAARQAPASGEVEPVAWVNCPVCGEPDMQKTEHERGTTLIHCCNHNCASNGGSNSVALAHPPTKVPEGWKLVPIEPTGDMEEAGCQAYMDADGNWVMHRSSMGHAYKAMINATPPQEQ